MTTTWRWVLVPVSAAAIGAIGFGLGLAAVRILEAFCPPELVVSGQCTASWYEPTFEILVIVHAGLTASLFVLVPAFVAPAHRLRVAAFAFFLGAGFPVYAVLSHPSLWGASWAAILVGALSLCFAASKWQDARSMI